MSPSSKKKDEGKQKSRRKMSSERRPHHPPESSPCSKQKCSQQGPLAARNVKVSPCSKKKDDSKQKSRRKMKSERRPRHPPGSSPCWPLEIRAQILSNDETIFPIFSLRDGFCLLLSSKIGRKYSLKWPLFSEKR